MRLLVVDWDYFFPNRMMMHPDFYGSDIGLYDWGHFESPMMISSWMWVARASNIDVAGKPRPTVNGTDGWWDRFSLPDAPLLVSDSNLYAALASPSLYGKSVDDDWTEVWLFDAHHDCGYVKGAREKYLSDQVVTCENWMIPMAENGAELHVRYPQWRAEQDKPMESAGVYECEPRPEIPVDRAIDLSSEEHPPFDGVFVCRSGAWVPAWCDDKFEEFVSAYPGTAVWVDEHTDRDRGWDEAAVRDLVGVHWVMDSLPPLPQVADQEQ